MDCQSSLEAQSPAAPSTGWYQTLPDEYCAEHEQQDLVFPAVSPRVGRNRFKKNRGPFSLLQRDLEWSASGDAFLEKKQKRRLGASAATEFGLVLILCVLLGVCVVGLVSFFSPLASPPALLDSSAVLRANEVANVAVPQGADRHLQPQDAEDPSRDSPSDEQEESDDKHAAAEANDKPEETDKSGDVDHKQEGNDGANDNWEKPADDRNQNAADDDNTERDSGRTVVVMMQSKHDSQPYVELKVGTPPQVLKARVDTSLSLLLLPSVECGDDACRQRHRVYNHTKSSSYQQSSDRSSTGDLVDAFDDVSLGDITVRHVGFAEVKDAPILSSAYTEAEWDAVLGLGYANGDERRDLLAEMNRQRLLNKPVFAMRMSRGDGLGELTVGGYDQAYESQLSWTSLTTPQSATLPWEVKLQGMDVTMRSDAFEVIISFSTSATSMAISSSLQYVSGPASDVDRLLEQLGARTINNRANDQKELPSPSHNEQMFVECDKTSQLANVEFLAAAGESNARLVISPDDYVLAWEGDTEEVKATDGDDDDSDNNRDDHDNANTDNGKNDYTSERHETSGEKNLANDVVNHSGQNSNASKEGRDMTDDNGRKTVKMCRVAFLHNIDQSSSGWILGQTLLRKYYTVFDFGGKQIGFAQAN